MKVSVKNEYGQLKSVILGRAEGANWPTGDTFFDKIIKLPPVHTGMTKGKISEEVISSTRDDLLYMKDVLIDEGVKVFRPEIQDYSKQFTHYGNLLNGMHSYSARDLLLSVGNMIIECPTPFISRYTELNDYDVIRQEAIRDGCKWIAAPRARMEPAEAVHKMARIILTERYPIFEASNVLKFDDKLLYLKSSTANQAGADWLQKVVGTEFEVITWDGVYDGAHIDTTLASLKKDLILINSSRVNSANNLPKFLRQHRKVWVHDCVERKFHKYPYASKWIGMNVLVINEERIMLDPIQTNLIKQLQTEFKIIEIPLTHSRTLGGGHHCVTNDLERE
jgi:hypothetical protein